MRLLRTFPLLAYAAVLLSIVGISAATTSGGLLIVCGVLAAMSWYVTEGPRGRSLPNWTANVLIIAESLNGMVDLTRHPDDVLGVLGRFIVWLSLIKLYQQKSARDYAQLLGLSLLLMLIGSLLTTDLLFAAILFLYALVGLYVLLLFQLYAAHQRTRAARLAAIPPGFRLLPSLQPNAGRRTALHLRTLMSGIAAAGLLFSVALFAIFPRDVGRGLIGALAVSEAARTGYADEVDLITGTRITESRKVSMLVTLPDGPAGVERPLRLRGAVLDQYDGKGRWTAWPRHGYVLRETQPPGFMILGTGDVEGARTLELEPLSPTWTLFSAGAPVAVSTGESRLVSYDVFAHTLVDMSSGWLRRYTVKYVPIAEAQASSGDPEPFDVSKIVHQFEDLDPGVERLARRLLASAGAEAPAVQRAAGRYAWQAEAAAVLTRHLQESDEFRYVTDLSDIRIGGAGGAPPDPIVQFLLETKRGHCEYFASALAAMCNSVGIPARLVTGYVAMEYDADDAVYLVRESNAHAWVEAEVGPGRWATFDPTPPATLRALHAATNSLSDRWRWILDRFQASWSYNFVAFDRRTQGQLMKALDPGWSQKVNDTLAATRQWLASVNRAFRLGPAGYIWMGIVALAAVIATFAVATRTRRARQLRAALRLKHVHGAAYHTMLQQLGFYLDMLKVLDGSGRAKPSWQPPLHYAGELAGRNPQGASLVRELTERFYAARYGDRRLTREEVQHARILVQELKRAMG